MLLLPIPLKSPKYYLTQIRGSFAIYLNLQRNIFTKLDLFHQLNKDEIQKSKLVVAIWDADLLSQDDYMSGVSHLTSPSMRNKEAYF